LRLAYLSASPYAMGREDRADLPIMKGKRLSKRENRETEQEYLKELKKDMDKRLSDLKIQMDALQERAAQKVADQPILALGVAFVAGMALGVALSRSGE
jgi:ElaB/YqjD/DUF883 family membrane-anchored ribosome-binding protein